MTSEERREQILDAAGHVIATRGIHAFRVRDIADEAGVSQPLVSAHFQTREEIILTTFERSDQRALELVVHYGRAARNGRERVARYVLGCLRDDPEMVQSWDLWHQVWTLGRFSPQIRERVLERQVAWTGLIGDVVRQGQDDGSISPDVDAARAGTLLVTLLDGVSPALQYGLMTLETAREIVTDALETTLQGSPAAPSVSASGATG